MNREKEHLAFVPKPIMVNDALLDPKIHREVLEEAIRWAKHSGHFVIYEGLERYADMVCPKS